MADEKELMRAVDSAIEQLKTKKKVEGEASALAQSLQREFADAMKPALQEMVQAVKQANMELAKSVEKSIRALKVEVPKMEFPPIEFQMPEVRVPEVRIPAPVVNVPAPIVNIPKTEIPAFPEMMRVMMDGVDNKRPLPVQMMGTDGKPMLFPFGQGGAKTNFLTIKGLLTPNGDSMVDDSNDALNVNVVTGTITSSPGLQISGAADSVNVIQFGGVDVGLGAGVMGPGTLRTLIATDNVVSVNIVSGSSAGTEYTEGTAPASRVGGVVLANDEDILRALQVGSGRDSLALRVVHATNVATSVEIASQQVTLDVRQVSGSEDSVKITSQAAALETRQVSGSEDSVSITSQGVTLDVRQVSGSEHSVVLNSSLVSLETKQVSGMAYSVEVTGATGTIMTVGSVVADAADDGSAPHKIGGIARTANPTAVAAGDRVSASFDDVGRQTMRPIQVRDLIQTALASLTNGTETTLLAGASGVFHDLIYIMGANNSDAAVSVDIRAATAANKVMTIQIPASGTAGVSLPIPIPQDVAADTWTADMPDITGTTVTLSALFSKEV